MALRAVPTRNLGARGVHPLIGTVAGKPAAALGVQRAAWQACISPALVGNVVLAGEATLKAKLHRPQARTAATVAGLPLSMGPAIVPQTRRACVAVTYLGNPPPYPLRFTSPTKPLHRWHSPSRSCR